MTVPNVGSDATLLSGSRGKVLYLVTEDWYFCSHRLSLARCARQAGYDVVVATRVGVDGPRICSEGFKLIPIRMRRRTMAPWRELATVAELFRLYREERPDIVHHVAMKPVIYGSIAARLGSERVVINALAGLGFVFSSHGVKAGFLKPLIKLALKWLATGRGSRMVVQNDDDATVLQRLGVGRHRVSVIKGSGVDLEAFAPLPEPDGPPVVGMVSRMLWDKGVGELVESARILKNKGEKIRVRLVGAPDPENPASITEGQLHEWREEGLVEWSGYLDDVAAVWAQAHIAVLPSYREGMPKALLEAAACARPIITCDVPGCREIVRDGENGILVPAKDPSALAQAIIRLARDATLRRQMGARGRQRVVHEFGEQTVIEKTLALYEDSLS